MLIFKAQKNISQNVKTTNNKQTFKKLKTKLALTTEKLSSINLYSTRLNHKQVNCAATLTMDWILNKNTTANKRLAKKRVQWLNEVLCFVSSSVLADSLCSEIATSCSCKQLACYLRSGKELNFSEKTCSINHRCKSGTRINNVGKGLELRQVNSPDSDFSTAVDSDSYLFLFSKSAAETYNGIYFTRIVTVAKMVNNIS